MRVTFRNADLERLECDPAFTAGFGPDVVKVFRKRIGFLRQSVDERDLYAMKSLHFEKLQGDRRHQRSIRLNDQYRLILAFETDEHGKLVVVIEVVDYH